MGAAAGLAGSLGGSTSNSSGTRDIAASTVQKLSDNITQASSAKRELQSTVVVHSTQAEHEAIETRTVVNYNHSHALTILYYEVLRHYRVVTEFVRRRPALLTNIHGGIAYRVTPAPPSTQPPYDDIWWPAIYENREVLEAALLDVRFKDCFDIVERKRHHGFVNVALGLPRDHKDKPQEQPQPPYGPKLRFFVFDMKTGGWNSDENDRNVQVEATLWPKNIKLVARNNDVRLNPQGTFWISDQNNSFVGINKTRLQVDTKDWKAFVSALELVNHFLDEAIADLKMIKDVQDSAARLISVATKLVATSG